MDTNLSKQPEYLHVLLIPTKKARCLPSSNSDPNRKGSTSEDSTIGKCIRGGILSRTKWVSHWLIRSMKESAQSLPFPKDHVRRRKGIGG